MTTADTQPPRTVAISVSESPDMAALGLSNEHLREAACEIAIHLLASGANLAYGGDLRPGGFTEMLLELLYRYRRRVDASAGAGITNYLAWPVHIGMNTDTLDGMVTGLRGRARLELIGQDGGPMSVDERRGMQPRKPDDREWSEGLTAMRRVMCGDTDARVVLGGRVEGYKGRMPGIAEEVLLSLELHQPVFLIGGFGGCARDVAETMGLVDAWAGSRPAWPGRDLLKRFTVADLRNGLSDEENAALARSQYMGRTVTLVMRGLRRLRERQSI